MPGIWRSVTFVVSVIGGSASPTMTVPGGGCMPRRKAHRTEMLQDVVVRLSGLCQLLAEGQIDNHLKPANAQQ